MVFRLVFKEKDVLLRKWIFYLKKFHRSPTSFKIALLRNTTLAATIETIVNIGLVNENRLCLEQASRSRYTVLAAWNIWLSSEIQAGWGFFFNCKTKYVKKVNQVIFDLKKIYIRNNTVYFILSVLVLFPQHSQMEFILRYMNMFSFV